MKLLFDQNISPKITKQLAGDFPESTHVRRIGLVDASDSIIFDYAKNNNFTIVTFDSDFVDLNIVRGIPPKIIWLKTGNLTTRAISEMLTKNSTAIQDFLKSNDGEILEIIKNVR